MKKHELTVPDVSPTSILSSLHLLSSTFQALGNVMYARHGGFVEGAEMFDSGFFGMSAAEAKTIVPWQ